MKLYSDKTDGDTLTISRLLRLLRTIDDISAKDLSKEIGLSATYISEIETGKKEPTLRVLNAYGAYFGISPANLLYIQEENLHGSNAELIVKIIEKRAEAERKRSKVDSKAGASVAVRKHKTALQPA
jgi:transcriptional regulator with XRE-family HTH domain